MAQQLTYPARGYPNADLQAAVARMLWRWSGAGARKRLQKWAVRWLRRHAPVVVGVAETSGARMVLGGPCFCARDVLLTGGFETADAANFRSLVRPGMTVFDVGANLGIYTLTAAARVGASGAVHAFEPVPDNFAYLSDSVRLSKQGNVTLNRVAVADRCDRVRMHLAENPKHAGWHSLAPSPDRTCPIEVDCITLDDYAESHGIRRVDFIKMDVEGAELLALRGAAGLLRGPDPPLIQAELCDEHTGHFGYSPRDVKRFLQGFGYAGYQRAPDGEWRRVDENRRYGKHENVVFATAGILDRRS